MKLFKFVIFCCVCYFSSLIVCFAQVGLPFQILITSPDARYSGMGDAGTAVADDIYAMNKNPGGLGFLKHSQLKNTPYFEASSSTSLLPLNLNSGKTLTTNIGGLYIDALKGTIAGDLNFMELGEMTRTHESGRVLGKYSSSELSLGIAYGTTFGEDWGFGAKVKYYQSNLASSSPQTGESKGSTIGGAFDIGLLWIPEMDFDSNSIFDKKSFSVGISILNIGPKGTYRIESEPLPATLRFGVAMKLKQASEHKLTLTADCIKYLIKRDSLGSDPMPKSLFTSWEGPLNFSFGLGAEYWYLGHYAFRAGYYIEPVDIDNRNFITLGTSVRFWILQADISYFNSSAINKYLTNVLKITFRVGG